MYLNFLTLPMVLYAYFVSNMNSTWVEKYEISPCLTFTVGSGTGCDWMCNYCASKLGPSYYFTTDVCQYGSGGCVGNPVAGESYTCCEA